jgi:Cryptococcal mannosyltransferase 1
MGLITSITGHDTSHMDTQAVRSAIEELLGLNGWVVALCPTLVRPFGQNKRDDGYYEELVRQDHLYYVAIVIHSADHFLVDQLAVIVQLAKRLGTQNLFVSMLDYDSTDATQTLLDLCEAVLTLLGVPFRIRRVSGMTEDPSAAYYPMEEATTRNLVLQPLKELAEKRGIRFHRVIWLKGFTCPNDILELIKVSDANEAAMVCGMDWAELNGFFIFSDRLETFPCSELLLTMTIDGGRVIWMEINSANPSLRQNLKQVHPVTRKARHAMHCIFLFKYSAASRVPTWLILLNHIIGVSPTGREKATIICRLVILYQSGTQKLHVWILVKHGSAEIFGLTLQEMGCGIKEWVMAAGWHGLIPMETRTRYTSLDVSWNPSRRLNQRLNAMLS